MTQNSHDLAYLALLAGEMQQLPYIPGAYASRRALMTAFCYSKLAGVPLEGRFLVFPRGPVSEEALAGLDALEGTEVLKDVSLDPEAHAHLIPFTGSLALAAQHRPWLTEQRETARAVLSALAPLTPERLDQAALLHFLALHLKQQETTPLAPAVVRTFLEVQEAEGWTLTAAAASALFLGLVNAHVIDCDY